MLLHLNKIFYLKRNCLVDKTLFYPPFIVTIYAKKSLRDKRYQRVIRRNESNDEQYNDQRKKDTKWSTVTTQNTKDEQELLNKLEVFWKGKPFIFHILFSLIYRCHRVNLPHSRLTPRKIPHSKPSYLTVNGSDFTYYRENMCYYTAKWLRTLFES